MKVELERASLIPDGIYKIRVTDTEDRTSAAGNPYVNLTCDVLDENGRSTGTTVWNTLTMTPKAKFMVGKFLDAIGAPPTGTVNSRIFKGKVFWAKLGKDSYQGKTKNVVVDYLTPEQAGKDPETINNVFNLELGDEPENKGFNEDDIESWDDDDDSPVVAVPDELTEDSRF